MAKIRNDTDISKKQFEKLPSVVDGTDTHAPHSAFPGPSRLRACSQTGGETTQKTDLPG